MRQHARTLRTRGEGGIENLGGFHLDTGGGQKNVHGRNFRGGVSLRHSTH